MRGTYVKTQRTRVTPDALRDALSACLERRGVRADAHTLTALVAMSAHETGRWASCWNYNFGNVKASPSWTGQYICLNNVWEVLNGVTRWFSPRGETRGKGGPLIGPEYPVPPGHPQTRFRAYATLAEGVESWAAKMATYGAPGVVGYRQSLDVLLAGGSTNAFLKSLKGQRYFTGDLVKYQASVRSYYREFCGYAHAADVRDVQTSLTRLGYDPGGADGIPGALTTGALVAFQSDRGIKADGVANQVTRGAINESLKRLT